MNELYWKTITKQDVIVMAIVLLITPFVVTPDTDSVQAIVFANYTTLVINVSFIIFSYIKYCRVNAMYNIISVRIGRINVLKYSIQFGISAVLGFSILMYGYMLIVYGMPYVGYEFLVLKFIFLNTICFLIEQFAMAFLIGSKSTLPFVLFAILLNVIFHYYFVQIYFII